jgi:hypothetical protein
LFLLESAIATLLCSSYLRQAAHFENFGLPVLEWVDDEYSICMSRIEIQNCESMGFQGHTEHALEVKQICKGSLVDVVEEGRCCEGWCRPKALEPWSPGALEP